MLAVGEALAPECPLMVKQATTLIKIFCWVLLFHLHSNCHCWRRCRQILLDSSLGFCDCGRSSFHVVGKVLVVVVKVETLCGITLRFLDFGDAMVLNLLVLFV